MQTNKPTVIIDFYKLGKNLQEQVKLVYPNGFVDYLIHFKNDKGQQVSALRFETDEKIYMLRMSAQMAFQILEDDDDYDDNHNLKNKVRKTYKEKHSDVSYLAENEDYETL